MPTRRPFHPYLCAAFLFSACSSGPDISRIGESSQGAVYLTRVSDRALQAAHPIKIDPTIIALVLNGILIRDDQGTNQEVRRVFSGSEVGYLAPMISDGLRRATPDQQVAFRAGPSGEPSPQTSASGVMYAYGRSLYVTLTQYRTRLDTASAADIAATRSTISFIPEAARRADSFLDSRSSGNALVIDYELLAALPPASTPSSSALSAPASPAHHTTTEGRTDPPSRDAELEALRKELQEIKKQLAEQQAERARAQPQKPVP